MAMNPRLLRPKATGFNPKTIPGLQLWFDASVSSSVTLNSGNVSQWNDLSGNSRHLEQSTAANQPAYLTNGRNGKNVIDFGSTNGKWMRQALASVNTITQPITFFWAFKLPASSGYTVSDVGNAASDGTGRVVFFGNAATEMRFDAGVGNVLQNLTADSWHVVTCVFNGTASQRRVNTTTSTVISAGTRSYSDRLYVGANFGAASGLRSLLGELGVYSGSLSDAQHTAILRYLSNKWAVTLT